MQDALEQTEDNAADESRVSERHPASSQAGHGQNTDFSAILMPHRSLSPKGFVIFMVLVSVVSFTAGLFFYLKGAWPVFGFFGLDVVLIYTAFRLNYRAGRLYETVHLTQKELTIRRIFPSGRRQTWHFNPYWVRVKVIEESEERNALALSSHGKHLFVGSFLSNGERVEFAEALQAALDKQKDGALQNHQDMLQQDNLQSA